MSTAVAAPQTAMSAEQAKKLGQNIGGIKHFGPLTIEYSIDLAIPQITGKASLYGAPIGSILLNPEHPDVTLGGSVGIGEAKVELSADFDKKEIDYDVEVSVFGHNVYKGSGRLFSW